ncbi:centromere-associated protein E-like [Zophobas morio]|uniref:centromere-associated protein E-like n=1 Tax=Zophobas morio TaxID=2755281 RepID=UPI003083E544
MGPLPRGDSDRYPRRGNKMDKLKQTKNKDEGKEDESFSTSTNDKKETSKDEDPFKRRESLSRTPPEKEGQKVSSLRTNWEPWGLGRPRANTNGSDTEKGAKRKATESPENKEHKIGRDANLLKRRHAEAEERLSKELEVLGNFIQENRNVHVPVKKSIEIIQRSYKKLIEIIRVKEEEEDEKGKEWQKKIDTLKGTVKHIEEESKITKKKLEEKIAAVHEEKERLMEKLRKAEKMAERGVQKMNVTKQEILEADNREKFDKIKNNAWEQNAFENVEVVVGNPLSETKSECMVVIAEPGDPDMNRSIQKMFRDRYPEMTEMRNNFEIIENVVKTRNIENKDEVRETTRKIIKIKTIDTKDDLWDLLKKVREYTKEEKIENIVTHKIAEIEGEELRKMMQCIFMETQTKIKMYVPKSLQAETGKRQIKATNSYAIVVEKKGVDYNTLLKEVKATLAEKEDRKAIRTVRSTRDGKMLIITDKDQEKEQNIRKTIIENIEEANVRQITNINRNKKTLFIRNLDATTNKEEVKQAIRRELGDRGEVELKVGEVRPTRNNTQTITITIDKDSAEILIRKEFVMIGIVKGKIEERMQMTRCYRCWGYGHAASECLEEIDRRNTCYKCGKEGHQAGQCNNEAKCPLCEKEGHTAGSSACKIFRIALKEAKRSAESPQKLN